MSNCLVQVKEEKVENLAMLLKGFLFLFDGLFVFPHAVSYLKKLSNSSSFSAIG